MATAMSDFFTYVWTQYIQTDLPTEELANLPTNR